MELEMLVFGAHPDDAEIGMGATIAKLTKAGKRVGICDLTEAEMSSNGTIEIRREEAEEAGRILGLASRSNLRLPDRGLFMEPHMIEPIVQQIRQVRPRIVFVPYWVDRHPDHVMCSKLVQEAIFNAKLRRYMPEIESWTVERTYFYFINDLAEPNIVIDVSNEHGIKMQALRAYRSQFEQASEHNQYVATPINQLFLERIEARDCATGQLTKSQYAESFKSLTPIQLNIFE